VPKHWDVIRLKYLTNVFEQGWSPQCEARLVEGNEYGVLKVGCVNSGCFDPLEHKALPENLKPQKQYLVKKNDLLISRANTKGLVGSSAVVEKDYDNLILCDKLYRLRFRSHVNPYLISEFIRAPMVRKQIELSASGASHSMQNIGQDTIKELFVAFPPESETQHLIAFIKNKIRIFNSLIDLSHRQVVLLQERRTALISAAVTGKIDVRDWVAPDSQSVEEPKEATA
jgi:type I restriction enzyme S subunit